MTHRKIRWNNSLWCTNIQITSFWKNAYIVALWNSSLNIIGLNCTMKFVRFDLVPWPLMESLHSKCVVFYSCDGGLVESVLFGTGGVQVWSPAWLRQNYSLQECPWSDRVVLSDAKFFFANLKKKKINYYIMVVSERKEGRQKVIHIST